METYNQKVDIWSIGVVTYYLFLLINAAFQASTHLLDKILSSSSKKYAMNRLPSSKRFGNQLVDEVSINLCSNRVYEVSAAKK